MVSRAEPMQVGQQPPQRNSFWGSLRIQRRVIFALLMREVITRYGRKNVGMLWLFIEPMMFTLVIAWLWQNIRAFDSRYGIPIFAFALTGYSTVLLWRNMPSHCLGAIKANAVLFYHRNVKSIDVYAARLILEAAGATLAFLVLAIVFIWLGMMEPPEDLMKVLIGWSMSAWFGVSLALCIAPLGEKTEVVARIWRPISYVMLPLSGVIFMVSALPPQAQKVILILPMVHGVECIRDGFFGHQVETIYDLSYMALVNLGLMFLGLIFVRVFTRTPDLSA